MIATTDFLSEKMICEKMTGGGRGNPSQASALILDLMPLLVISIQKPDATIGSPDGLWWAAWSWLGM
jgi:hypothetical protein